MADVWTGCREVAAWTVVDIAGGPLEDEVDDYTLEPGRDALAASLVRSADVVVIVGAADPVGVRRLLQLVGQFDEGERPAGRIEVAVNRVRASAAGPSPERAVREALARFGGLEEVTLLPEDPVADQCLLAGCSVLDGAPGSALGRALAILVDRIDPAAGARRTASRQRRRGLLRRWRDRRAERRSPPRTAGPGRDGADAPEDVSAPVAASSAPEAPGASAIPSPPGTPGAFAPPVPPASAPPLPFAVSPPGTPMSPAPPGAPGASAPPPPPPPPMPPRTMPPVAPSSAAPTAAFPPSAATPFTAPSSATSPAPRTPSQPMMPPVTPPTARETPQRTSREARRPPRRRKGRHAS